MHMNILLQKQLKCEKKNVQIFDIRIKIEDEFS